MRRRRQSVIKYSNLKNDNLPDNNPGLVNQKSELVHFADDVGFTLEQRQGLFRRYRRKKKQPHENTT